MIRVEIVTDHEGKNDVEQVIVDVCGKVLVESYLPNSLHSLQGVLSTPPQWLTTEQWAAIVHTSEKSSANLRVGLRSDTGVGAC
jgi:hypothetical protein